MGIEKRFDPSPAPNFEVMKIPKEFKLMGETIKVRFVSDLNYKDDFEGVSKYRDSEILIQESTNTWPRTQEQIEQTFLHELTHYILEKLNERELRDNEKFVNTFAGLLHQALTTQK